MTEHHEQWAPGRTIPLQAILGVLRRGPGDPTMVVERSQIWWALMTPVGPAATWWRVLGGETDAAHLSAYGPGAVWFTGRLAQFLGQDDDVSGFTAHHDRVRRAWHQPRNRDWRVPRTGLVWQALVPSILEQKVTGKQAFAGYRYLVRRHGQPVVFPPQVLEAAGPHARRVAGLVAAPEARVWRRIPSWEWLHAGVEPSQSRTVLRAAEVAHRLEETTDLPRPDAHRRLRTVPGVGLWTAAKVAQSAWGDADAPTFGDYHVAKQVGHAILGRDLDDAGMAALLAPYRGHRFRAERLMLADGFLRERHGARMSLPAHLPSRSF